jgi:hypothetical protein
MNSASSVLDKMPEEDVEVKEAFANRVADVANWIFVTVMISVSWFFVLKRIWPDHRSERRGVGSAEGINKAV